MFGISLTVFAETESDLADISQILSRQVVGFGLRGFDTHLSLVQDEDEE